MSEIVRVRERGGVAVVEMNLPEKRNAMGTALLEALVGSLQKAAAEEATRAIVITGAGGVFSSGADLSEQVDARGARQRMRLFTRLYELTTFLVRPTVAAVAGPCIGGGAEVAAACDLRVGAPSASFKFPGAQFGIPVGSARLEALVGLSHAKDLLLTSRTFGAEEAHRIGFLNRLVEEEHLEDEAVGLAETMAGNPGALEQKRRLAELSGLHRRVDSENRALRRWQEER